MSDIAQDLDGVALLPCPFCGGGAYWRNGRCEPSFYVACKNCEVIGPVTVTLDTAITAWNTRPALLATVEGRHD